MNSVKLCFAITMGAAAVLAFGAARAQDAKLLQSECLRLEYNAEVSGVNAANLRIRYDFLRFAGSDANMDSLITGLRKGSPITLTARSGTYQVLSNITFASPVGAMGAGNVYISLAFAKQWLSNRGITQPTPSQIKAVLVGGTVSIGSGTEARTVILRGVLTQRRLGMGWNNVARSHGLTLEPVVRGLQSANHDLWVIRLHRLVASYDAVTTNIAFGG